MWSAIRYVTSWITLIAFICAVAAWAYRSYLLKRERLIKSVPEGQRARLVEKTFVLFKVDTAKLSPEHQYNLALKQIREQARQFHVTAAAIVVITALAALLTYVAIPRLIPSPAPPPVPSPTPSSACGNLSGEIEEVAVAPQGGNAQVFIRMSIKNTGHPTPVQQYAVRINHVSSKVIDYKGPLDDFSGRHNVPQPGGKKPVFIQQSADSLITKTQQAIRTGDRVSGWLRLALPLPEHVLRQAGIWYTVSFADADGKRCEVTHEVR